MKLILVSNYISHHQLPLAREAVELLGADNFKFVVTQQLDSERKKIGWTDEVEVPWILKLYENARNLDIYHGYLADADVVLSGERIFLDMEKRLQNGKVCFYMSERWWKPPLGISRLLSPKFLSQALRLRRISNHPLFRYLAIGPFAHYDLSRFGVNSSLQWGYFTNLSRLIRSPSQTSGSREIKILWIGRMLKWKRVDVLLKSLKVLAKTDFSFKLTLVGDGPEKARLYDFSREHLGDAVTFCDPVPATAVYEIMQKHDVFVMPSSAYEGWGAVVNEAMSCGCVVVSSDAIGSSRSMIVDRYNGLLYSDADVYGLCDCLLYLFNNPNELNNIGFNAVQTLRDTWSPKVAANRLISYSSALCSGKPLPSFENGPLSNFSIGS